jgi:integrase
MRNFLKSRNVAEWDTISGKLEKQKGQYAHLYTPKENIEKIFEWLKAVNYDAYLATKFSFKCGGVRLTATLNAKAQCVNEEDKTIIVFEKANRNAPKRRITKEIPDNFFEELLPRIKNGGKLFKIKKAELTRILRACYKAVIPELETNIPMPFHFWRHQFAQHMLRATNWDYALVADLGGWKIQTLQDYYGAFDRKTLKEYARQKLAEI